MMFLAVTGRSRAHHWLHMSLVVAWLCVGSTAFAESASALARLHYENGTKRYNLGEYSTALDEFKAAYLAKADPAFLFNIAQCQRHLGQFEAAGKSYRAFVRESPQLPPATREQVERLVAEMEKRAKDVAEPPREHTTPPPPTIAPRPPAAPPPSPITAEIPAVSRAAAHPSPWYKRPAGWTTLAIGIAVAGVGGGLLGHAGALDSEADTASTLSSQKSLLADRDTFGATGWALVGVGTAATVAGVIVIAVSAARHSSGARR